MVTVIVALLMSTLQLVRPEEAAAVVGGSTVTVDEQAAYWPFIVDLSITSIDGSGSTCTGSVIAPRAVATAAHCLIDASRISLVFNSVGGLAMSGDHMLSTRFVRHPDYSWSITPGNIWHTSGPDIGIIYLPSDAPVTPIEMAVEYPEVGDLLEVAGYGMTSASNSNPLGTLNEAFQLVRDCHPLDTSVDQLIDVCVTASGGSSGGLHCFGDSGGPVVSREDGVARLVAIVSRGDCAGRGVDALAVGANRYWLNWYSTRPSESGEAILHGSRMDHNAWDDYHGRGLGIDVWFSTNNLQGRDLEVGVGFRDSSGRYVGSNSTLFQDAGGNLRAATSVSSAVRHSYTSDPIRVYVADFAWNSLGPVEAIVWVYDVIGRQYLAVESAGWISVSGPS